MKKYFISALLILCVSLNAQVNRKKNTLTLPPFNIVLADGSQYRATDLPEGKPVIIVYFDPDCDHCETFISKMQKDAEAFKNAQVVLITYVSLQNLKTFVQKSGLDQYPFIVGTEGESFIVRYHYDVIQFPYVALHKPDGSLIATYESQVPPPSDLAKMLVK